MSHLTLLARLSQCVLWLSVIPNRLRLNGVTRKDYVFRVTVELHHRCVWGSAIINSCYAQRRFVSVTFFTQIPWLWHKFRCRGSLAVCHHYSFTTRATRKEYVFHVTWKTMCSIVVVCSSHVSNMIMTWKCTMMKNEVASRMWSIHA